MNSPFRILITDDHRMLRETWTTLLNGVEGISVVGSAGTGNEAIAQASALEPDIVLMDIHIGSLTGFEVTERILADRPKCKVVGLSMSQKPAHVKRFFSIGAVGYLSKNCSFDEVIYGILEVAKGNSYISKDIKDIITKELLLDESDSKRKLDSLSKRELEIIGLIKQGLSSKEIALQLDLTLKTVEVHRYNILKKLEVRNRAELVNWMNEMGV